MPQRSDDIDIADTELLLRRICDIPQWINSKDGQIKPSSAAFLDNYTNEVSVSVSSLTTQEKTLEGYPNFGLVSIEAGMPRSHNHIVAKTPEVSDTSHRVICPPSDLGKGGRKSVARLMANASKWILYPRTHRGE